jgi:hypothetical protein
MSATQRLLRAAQLRLRVAAVGRAFRAGLLNTGALLLAGLLAARLLGVLPNTWFTPLSFGLIAGVALVAALLLHRRTSMTEVARTVDARAGSKELFLTAAFIEKTPGAYREVVAEQAEARAGKVSAARLLPFHWAPGLRDAAIVAALVAAAYLWLPQLDPFKMDARRQTVTKQQERLEETRKITAVRKQELEAKSSILTEQVDLALAKLDQTLKQAKPQERELNAKKLNEEAQDFSELWKKLANELPKSASEQMEKAAQNFGDAKNQQELKELIKQLKQGDPKGLQQALEKMREDLKAIAEQPPGPEQKKQMEKLARELAKMTDKLREQLGEKGVDEALKRALEQMDAAKMQDLAKQAAEAAGDSLQLSKEELERVAEMFKDMKNVEDAMKNLQAAKQLNEKGGLDGKDAKDAGAESQGDYEKLYQKLLAERGGGQQIGRGGGQNPQVGAGGTVGEDKTAKTNTKEEKAKTKTTAGALLMQWKDEGVGDIGQRTADYEAAVRAVKEGVAEAIRNEQVPPGYHSAIQKYFDRLPAEPRK